ncbi:MAG: alternative oxidase [Candidatus Paracaedibacteraceae bacterium]|nr:alternative oxidase [Candidatus Paracaedibacteraceae bacterium]
MTQKDSIKMTLKDPLITHRPPSGISDYIAYGCVKFLRFFADIFFAKRYGNRAVVLETVAGVPGMVGGMLQHLKSLRSCKEDDGWIKELLAEAENERMHLMTFIQIAKPNLFERFLIIFVQVWFFAAYFVLYIVSSRTAHRIVGYLEEEAVISYTQYLKEIDDGKIENIPAPDVAINYWGLSIDARLRDVVIAARQDEICHRDRNHDFANELLGKR